MKIHIIAIGCNDSKAAASRSVAGGRANDSITGVAEPKNREKKLISVSSGRMVMASLTEMVMVYGMHSSIYVEIGGFCLSVGLSYRIFDVDDTEMFLWFRQVFLWFLLLCVVPKLVAL